MVNWIASEDDYGRNWSGTEGSELSIKKSSFTRGRNPETYRRK